jgi:hypothetical protein
MSNLSLQIRQLDQVIIGDDKVTDTGSGEIHSRGTAQSAHADYKHGRID